MEWFTLQATEQAHPILGVLWPAPARVMPTSDRYSLARACRGGADRRFAGGITPTSVTTMRLGAKAAGGADRRSFAKAAGDVIASYIIAM